MCNISDQTLSPYCHNWCGKTYTKLIIKRWINHKKFVKKFSMIPNLFPYLHYSWVKLCNFLSIFASCCTCLLIAHHFTRKYNFTEKTDTAYWLLKLEMFWHEDSCPMFHRRVQVCLDCSQYSPFKTNNHKYKYIKKANGLLCVVKEHWKRHKMESVYRIQEVYYHIFFISIGMRIK